MSELPTGLLQDPLRELTDLLTQVDDSVRVSQDNADQVEQQLERVRPQLQQLVRETQDDIARLRERITQGQAVSEQTRVRVEQVLSQLQVELESNAKVIDQLDAGMASLRERRTRVRQIVQDSLTVMRREVVHLAEQDQEGLLVRPDPTIRGTAALLRLSLKLAELTFSPEELQDLANRPDRYLMDTLRQQWINWIQDLTGYLSRVLSLGGSLDQIEQQGLLKQEYHAALVQLAEQCRALAESAQKSRVPSVPRPVAEKPHAVEAPVLVVPLSSVLPGPTMAAQPLLTILVEDGKGNVIRQQLVTPPEVVGTAWVEVREVSGTPLRFQIGEEHWRVRFQWRSSPDDVGRFSKPSPELPKGTYGASITRQKADIWLRLNGTGDEGLFVIK